MGQIQQGVTDPLTQTAFDNSQAGVNQTTYPVVIVGQVLNANPQPCALTALFSKAQAINFAGAGSQLARMVSGYISNDLTAPIYVIPVADNSGASAAVYTMLITGVATGAGTWALRVAGYQAFAGVITGQTAVQSAAAIVAAVNANANLPVVALAIAAADTTLRKVQFTAKNVGTIGNSIQITLNDGGLQNGESTPPGQSATMAQPTMGATDPDLVTANPIAAVLGDQKCRFLIHPYAGSTGMGVFGGIMNESTGRWASTRKSWGHCWTAEQGSPTTLASYGPSNDDPHSTVLGYEAGARSMPDEAAAIFCGAQAASIRNQPNLPTTNRPLIGFFGPPTWLSEANGGAFQKTTRNALEQLGLATIKYSVSGPAVSLCPTTYQFNTFGQPDQSYFYTQTMYQLMAIADAIDGMETQEYSNTLLGDDGVAINPGIPFTSPALFKARMAQLAVTLQGQGLIQNVQAFVAASVAARNSTAPGQLDTIWAPQLVVGLYQVTNLVQFRFYSAAAASALIQAAA